MPLLKLACAVESIATVGCRCGASSPKGDPTFETNPKCRTAALAAICAELHSCFCGSLVLPFVRTMDIDSVQSKSLPVNSRNEEGTVASPRLLTVPFSVLDDDICSQDLMEVDVHTSLQASGATTSGLLQSSLHQGVQRGRSSRVSCVLQTTRKTLPSAGTMHQVTGVTPVSPFNRNFLLHAAFVASKDIREDATGAVGMSPVPTPPVAVVTRSDITSWP